MTLRSMYFSFILVYRLINAMYNRQLVVIFVRDLDGPNLGCDCIV